MRHEFIESLIRIAEERFGPPQGIEREDPPEPIRRLLEEHVPQAAPEALFQPDNYRVQRLYHESADKVLKQRLPALTAVYVHYANRNPIAGKAVFGLREWLTLLKEASVIR